MFPFSLHAVGTTQLRCTDCFSCAIRYQQRIIHILTEDYQKDVPPHLKATWPKLWVSESLGNTPQVEVLFLLWSLNSEPYVNIHIQGDHSLIKSNQPPSTNSSPWYPTKLLNSLERNHHLHLADEENKAQ